MIPRQGGFHISDNFTLPIDTVGRHYVTLSLTCASPGMETGAVVVSEASAHFQARRCSAPRRAAPRRAAPS